MYICTFNLTGHILEIFKMAILELPADLYFRVQHEPSLHYPRSRACQPDTSMRLRSPTFVHRYFSPFPEDASASFMMGLASSCLGSMLSLRVCLPRIYLFSSTVYRVSWSTAHTMGNVDSIMNVYVATTYPVCCRISDNHCICVAFIPWRCSAGQVITQ